MSSLLEGSLRDGQALGVVESGDVRFLSWLTIGALKEVMFQIVHRGAEYEEDKLVDGTFAFFADGYLRIEERAEAPTPLLRARPMLTAGDGSSSDVE